MISKQVCVKSFYNRYTDLFYINFSGTIFRMQSHHRIVTLFAVKSQFSS